MDRKDDRFPPRLHREQGRIERLDEFSVPEEAVTQYASVLKPLVFPSILSILSLHDVDTLGAGFLYPGHAATVDATNHHDLPVLFAGAVVGLRANAGLAGSATYRFYVQKNGADTGFVDLAGGTTVASNTATFFTVVAGDIVGIRVQLLVGGTAPQRVVVALGFISSTP